MFCVKVLGKKWQRGSLGVPIGRYPPMGYGAGVYFYGGLMNVNQMMQSYKILYSQQNKKTQNTKSTNKVTRKENIDLKCLQ